MFGIKNEYAYIVGIAILLLFLLIVAIRVLG
jgi:hypothetical protein